MKTTILMLLTLWVLLPIPSLWCQSAAPEVYAAAQGVELLQVERGWQVRSLAKGLDTSMPLQGGDVVVKVGGRDTATLGPLSICYLLSEAAIRSLPVTVRRQSREVELRLPGAGAGDGGPTLAEFLQRYGIGAQIVSRKDPPGSFINEILPGGPAAKAGLQKGDELIAVDGQQVSALPLAEAVQLLVTQQPAIAHLRIRREGRVLDVEVQRVPTSQLYGSPRASSRASALAETRRSGARFRAAGLDRKNSFFGRVSRAMGAFELLGNVVCSLPGRDCLRDELG